MDILWVGVAFVFGMLVSRIKLPPLVGYLAAGAALSAYGYHGGPALEEIAHFSVVFPQESPWEKSSFIAHKLRFLRRSLPRGSLRVFGQIHSGFDFEQNSWFFSQGVLWTKLSISINLNKHINEAYNP